MSITAEEVAALLDIEPPRVFYLQCRPFRPLPLHRIVNGHATWDRAEIIRWQRDNDANLNRDVRQQELVAQFAPVGRGLPGQQPVVRRRTWV